MAVKPQPDGYHAVMPYLVVPDADRLIEFLAGAFDARETERLAAPNNRIAHAEMRIGDSVVMLGEARDGHKARTCMLYLYVPDADATWQAPWRPAQPRGRRRRTSSMATAAAA